MPINSHITQALLSEQQRDLARAARDASDARSLLVAVPGDRQPAAGGTDSRRAAPRIARLRRRLQPRALP